MPNTESVKIANVTIEKSNEYMEQPSLWVRGTNVVEPGETGTGFVLKSGGEYDFTTFFNALSEHKWNEYTVATGYSLHGSIDGEFDIKLTEADSFSYFPDDIDGTERQFDGNGTHEFDIPVPVRNGATERILAGFKIKANSDLTVNFIEWRASVPEGSIRDVELAIGTTTFKKEQFICHNIDIVKERILGSKVDDIAGHFTMHIADNGRTLDAKALETDRVRIHPNPNAGGAGGFARNMIEAMRQEPKATHVILMDDDVHLSPESIIRTYNLLRIVKDEWKSAFVSGAMLNMDEPEIRVEDTGYMNEEGFCSPSKPSMRMSAFHDIVDSEAFSVNKDDPRIPVMKQRYQAWWYCCIPMTEIERRGMPLPLFVRFDDVEYSLRDVPKIMTMNGICVWHSPFYMRYDAAVERYQVCRNAFIIQHSSNSASESDFLKCLDRQVMLELKRFNYENANLALEGFEDFLKGPDVTFAPGFAEKRFMETHKMREVLHNLPEISDDLAELGIDWTKLTMDSILSDVPRSVIQRAFDFATCNGQRLPLPYTQDGKIAIMADNGGAYQGGSIRKADTIVAIDVQNRKGVIRHQDKDKFREVMARYKNDLNEYKKNRDSLDKAYKEAFKRMTTVEAWEEYLGMNGSDGE